MRISEQSLGEKHLNTATTYNNLAWMYESQGEYDKSIYYYLKAYKTFRFRLGVNHPHTQIVLENMERAYFTWHSEGGFDEWLKEGKKE